MAGVIGWLGAGASWSVLMVVLMVVVSGAALVLTWLWHRSSLRLVPSPILIADRQLSSLVVEAGVFGLDLEVAGVNPVAPRDDVTIKPASSACLQRQRRKKGGKSVEQIHDTANCCWLRRERRGSHTNGAKEAQIEQSNIHLPGRF